MDTITAIAGIVLTIIAWEFSKKIYHFLFDPWGGDPVMLQWDKNRKNQEKATKPYELIDWSKVTNIKRN